MKANWVLVADSSRARFFSMQGAQAELQEFEDDIHPGSRQHDRNITSDLPGKDSGVAGAGGHAYQEQTDPKEYESMAFAKELASHLEEAHNGGEYGQLMIVAAPAFLGELRKQMSDQVKQTVSFELDKNLTTHSAEDIRSHLP